MAVIIANRFKNSIKVRAGRVFEPIDKRHNSANFTLPNTPQYGVGFTACVSDSQTTAGFAARFNSIMHDLVSAAGTARFTLVCLSQESKSIDESGVSGAK